MNNGGQGEERNRGRERRKNGRALANDDEEKKKCRRTRNEALGDNQKRRKLSIGPQAQFSALATPSPSATSVGTAATSHTSKGIQIFPGNDIFFFFQRGS